tara:strand:+ start:5470 stop:6303 length:834 start_codon:yes stop_codon:yes gene_type:complete
LIKFLATYGWYIIISSQRWISTWTLAPGVYLMIIPLAFGNSNLKENLIDGQKNALETSGFSDNSVVLNAFGISNWDSIWSLEGLVSGYLMNLFMPLLIAVCIIGLMNKIGPKSEEDGTFEFVASLPFTRTMIFSVQAIILIGLGMLIPFVWVNLIFIMTLFVDASLNYSSLVQSVIQSALGGVSFAAFGFAIGAYTGKSSLSWAAGIGLLAIEWLSGMLAETNAIFEFVKEWISSFGAYNNPYVNGLDFADLSLVIFKILLFLIIGFWGYRDRSLNL